MIEHLQHIKNNVIRWGPWVLRGAVIWLLLGQLAPLTHRVFPQPLQTVQAEQPHVCVHTNLIDEVDEWKIQRSLELVREMGADTIVEFFPWAYIEPSEDNYQWQRVDRILTHAEQQGITIIARFGLVPSWARPRDSAPNFIPDVGFDEFAEYTTKFAARYAGRIDHYIIWNEPNLAFEWGFAEYDPWRYTRLLQAVYEPIHAANPNAVVLAGALAPTLEPELSPNGTDDLIYLRGMYEYGAADYFDALAVHTYGFTHPAEQAPAADRLNFRRAELIREVMIGYGDADTPVFITESGWNDNPRWTNGVRPSERIAHTLDALHMAEQDWPYVDQVCLWLLRYPRPQGNYRDNFTLITPEFQLKPIYYAVQAYARGWEQNESLWLPPPEDS